MQDADLFLELAAIAGVFVGFGALIAVRSAGAGDAFEVGFVRGVVSLGLLTILAALAPVTFARYPISDHQIWVLSSVVLLVGFAGTLTALFRIEGSVELELPRRVMAVSASAWVLWIIASTVVPIIIILGLAPELEAALYFTVVVLLLLWDAWVLLQLVFRKRRPATA